MDILKIIQWVGTIGGGTSEIMRDIIAKIIIDGKDYEAEKSKI